MTTRTIYTAPADGWHLAVTARAIAEAWLLAHPGSALRAGVKP